MTIGRQLTSLMAAFAIAMPACGLVLSYVTYQNQQQTRRLASERNRHTDELFALLDVVGQAQGVVQQVVRENDPDRVRALMSQAQTLGDDVQRRIQAIPSGGAGIARAFAELRQANQLSLDALRQGEAGLAQQLLVEQSNPAFDAVLAAMRGLQQESAKLEAAAAAALEARTAQGQMVMYGAGGFIMLLLCGFGALVVRRINTNFRRAVAELSAAARHTGSASGQFLTASNQQAQDASRQAANIEETSAAGEEVNSMAVANSESSRRAADLMERSKVRIAEAGIALDGMVASIDEIHAASQGVAKIMKVVDEIAFQTNILALNAAVEAARAGEAGAGFSVVADEVRNLARRSAQAAKDTAGLMEQSISLTTEGKRKVAGLVEAMRAITGDAGAVAGLVDEVSSGSRQQAGGAAQIAKALAEMERVTQRGAATAEESAAAAQELDTQAQALNGVVTHIAALVGQS